ncbi:MAG: NAD-dependent epimerase/dehydratase family protein, partial [Tateyamaria sp.]
GAGGFIGAHLVTRLKRDGWWVRGVDVVHPAFGASDADEFVLADLRSPSEAASVIDRRFDEVYQLAADMGGAGYIFSGDHDADIIFNSAAINLAVVGACRAMGVPRVFFSSSACVYAKSNQLDPDNPLCAEATAYPADPDSEYGWEKLFSERLYQTFGARTDMTCRVARYHNIFGPMGTWCGGREKAPAALCRKVAEAAPGETIEVWGDGQQTRSFLYIDECIEGTLRLMRSDVDVSLNIGSEEMIRINDLAQEIIKISGKPLTVRNIPGPTGVRGRNSDNRLIQQKLGWQPTRPLRDGLRDTYAWIDAQVQKAKQGQAA